MTVLSILKILRDNGILSNLDVEFALFIKDLEQIENKDNLTILAAFLSQSLSKGNVCINLNKFNLENEIKKELFLDSIGFDLIKNKIKINYTEFAAEINCYTTVGGPNEYTPLVLNRNRMYLRRFYQYEQEIATGINNRVLNLPDILTEPDYLDNLIEELFNYYETSYEVSKSQIKAVKNAVKYRFSIISGGPGTGKTTTILKILIILYKLNQNFKIALCAPTGKAAGRLNESVQAQKNSITCEPEIYKKLFEVNEKPLTLHRLLGIGKLKNKNKFSKQVSLKHDVIIVDESSMVDIGLLAKLFKSLKPESRLILVGDKDQLASVEAGNVLGDICNGYNDNCLDKKNIKNCITVLDKNFRAKDSREILNLAKAINSIEPDKVENCIKILSKAQKGIKLQNPAFGFDFHTGLKNWIFKYWKELNSVKHPLQAFTLFKKSLVMGCIHKGKYGVENINKIIKDFMDIPENVTWYNGKPVMILKNDYNLKLYNGDIGICLKYKGNLRVFFELGEDKYKIISPFRLPTHQSAYCITVHKSQGSEADNILLILPDKYSNILTSELIYTAITRARNYVEIWSDEQIFKKSVGKQIERLSGLSELLW